MPLIDIDGIGGKLTKKQKRELVKKVTKAASEATGISESSFMVLIKELDHDNIGSGGKLLSESLKNNLE